MTVKVVPEFNPVEYLEYHERSTYTCDLCGAGPWVIDTTDTNSVVDFPADLVVCWIASVSTDGLTTDTYVCTACTGRPFADLVAVAAENAAHNNRNREPDYKSGHQTEYPAFRIRVTQSCEVCGTAYSSERTDPETRFSLLPDGVAHVSFGRVPGAERMLSALVCDTCAARSVADMIAAMIPPAEAAEDTP